MIGICPKRVGARIYSAKPQKIVIVPATHISASFIVISSYDFSYDYDIRSIRILGDIEERRDCVFFPLCSRSNAELVWVGEFEPVWANRRNNVLSQNPRLGTHCLWTRAFDPHFQRPKVRRSTQQADTSQPNHHLWADNSFCKNGEEHGNPTFLSAFLFSDFSR